MINMTNLLGEFKKNLPFIYEDFNGLVAIGNLRVVEVCDERWYTKYEEYKKINIKDNMDKDDAKKIISKLLTSAKIQCRTENIHVHEGNTILPNSNYIEIGQYIEKLTEEEKESLIEQLIRFKNLYREYI